MFPLARHGRRTALAISVGLVLIASLLRPDARAASGTAVDADVTWGTGLAPTGRAQPVRALAVAGRTVYLGGEFTTMVPPGAGVAATEPQTRNHLAALDVDEHSLLPWDPDVDGPVRALAVSADGTKLYVGGSFRSIGGTPVSNLALLDLATGKVDTSFRPRVNGGVKGLALAGGRLYVGGDFKTVGGPAGPEARPKLAALDRETGELLPWEPPLLCPGRYVGHGGTPVPDDFPGDVLAVAVPEDGSRVYVGGTFLDFAGQGGLLVLDAATGRPLRDQYRPGRPVFSLAVSPADGETVFGSAGGAGGRVYAFSPTQPRVPQWATAVDGDAPGVAASDDTVYLMGHYDYAGPERALRRHLAAFDALDGSVEDWDPVANTPQGAFAAAVGADHVFVGGVFTRINGRPQPGFAQFALPPPTPPTTEPTSSSTTSSSTTSSTTTPPMNPATSAATLSSTPTTSSSTTTSTTVPTTSSSTTTSTTVPTASSPTTSTTVPTASSPTTCSTTVSTTTTSTTTTTATATTTSMTTPSGRAALQP